MRWAGRVALCRRGKLHSGFWWGNLREREHLEDQGVEGKKILRWIFRKWDGGTNWFDLDKDRDMWLVDTCKYSNEPSVSVNFAEFLDCLRTG